ncbi:MAG: formate dehydrogenase subunit gamma [Woeseiaceae bacterium]
MRAHKTAVKTRRRHRAAIITVLGSLLLAAALPLAGYVAYEAGLIQTVQAQESDEKSDEEAVNPRSEYWRAVREGTAGYSAVPGEESGVLIQNGGENWRNLRNGPITFFGGSLIIAVLIALLAKHIIIGKDKLESRTGRTVPRWSAFERVLHWYVAIAFIVLAITGMSLIFGRTILIPLMGKEGFAAWAQLAKPIHDYLSLPFAAGLAIMLVLWFGRNIPRAYDLKWLATLNGLIGDSHPPAGFANAGEKIFFWLLFFAGIAITVSGVFLLFPNLGTVRETMQFWHLVHAASGLFLIAVSLGHMYLGTIGTEGVFEGMAHGDVDEGFAMQHHNLWYEEIKGSARAPEKVDVARSTTTART